MIDLLSCAGGSTIVIIVGALITSVFGLIASSRDNTPRWITFPTLIGGIIALFGGVWAGLEQSQLNNDLHAKTEKIEKLTQDISDANSTIARSITGGDSFCYLHSVAAEGTSNRVVRWIIHHGEWPLYDVTVQSVDVNRLHAHTNTYNEAELQKWIDDSDDYEIFLGNINPGSSITNSIDLIVPTDNSDRHEYSVSFKARNGRWHQQIVYYRVDGTIKTSYRVSKLSETNTIVLKEHIDDGFPRNADGNPKW